VSAGGLAVAFAESCIAGEIGATVTFPVVSGDSSLFGEGQSRVVVSCQARRGPRLKELAAKFDVTLESPGIVGGDVLRSFATDIAVDELCEAYEGGLARALEGVTANA
jgi:phosphoribosylformylglycinamidine synthase